MFLIIFERDLEQVYKIKLAALHGLRSLYMCVCVCLSLLTCGDMNQNTHLTCEDTLTCGDIFGVPTSKTG